VTGEDDAVVTTRAEEEMLERIAAALRHDAPVHVGTMFRSPGIRIGPTIVAFLGNDATLIVKVPRERAIELVDEGTAEPVTMGRRTMREWVGVPAVDDPSATERLWTALAREALAFVRDADRPAD
jgi:hypothetical protein